MIEIILVRYKLPIVENDCLSSVLKNTSNYHLTVYDNAPHNENLGKLWNKLINRSDADTICLLNTDTLVEENWLTRLEETLEGPSWNKIGAVGPVTDNAHNAQKRDRGGACFRLPEGQMLSGFCLLFKKSIWSEVGGIPENFGFYGQETAFLIKVDKKGYTQWVNPSVFVHHLGSASAQEAQKRGEMDIKTEREAARKMVFDFANKK